MPPLNLLSQIREDAINARRVVGCVYCVPCSDKITEVMLRVMLRVMVS